MGHFLSNLALLGLAGSAALVLAEGVVRLRLDPVDYLMPELVPHPVLSHAIEPGSGGHDEWGFRNTEVPDRAPLVAIGDSQTYGVSAAANRSWPAELERLSERRVYNLALGGYGPPDYQHLLSEYATRLDPETVLIGFYFGNDLVRVAELAGHAPPAVSLPEEDDPRVLGELRTWLSRHSVLYQAVKLELPQIANPLRRGEASVQAGNAIELVHSVAGTYLTPERRLDVLDLERAQNRSALEATIRIFREMAATCRDRAIRCHLVLIPTKESVYADLARSLPPSERERVERLVAAEERVRERLVASFRDTGLSLVDPLPALRSAAPLRRLYPAHTDGHPNGDGYAVIAVVVSEALAGS